MSIEAMKASLDVLKGLFDDQPDALTVFDLESISSEYLKKRIREGKLFASPIKMWVTGRTGAGKTSLGNSLLDLKIMKSTGYMDCTDFVGFFKLGENLCYFDVPGYASDGNYENINRVALLMEQIEDPFSDPPAEIMQATDTFEVKDFSNCANRKDKPKVEAVTVEQWRSAEKQKEVSPDVIIYVNAPDKQFLQPDTQYLHQILKTWKERKRPCIVIPALNIFVRDGKVLPTAQNIEDARSKITRIYQFAYKNEWVPPIVEINALEGKGIEQLTELICKILPQEKVGNMQQVLREDLKQYAENEHTNRYYRTLSLIAGRLARHTVDKRLHGQNLLQAAATAISAYGVMTFKNAEELADIRGQMDSIYEEVELVEGSQQKAITRKRDVKGKKDITRIKPKTEQVEVEDVSWRPETRTKTVQREVWVQEARKETLEKQIQVPEEETREVKRSGFLGGFIDGLVGKKRETHTVYRTRTVAQDEMVLTPTKRIIDEEQSYTDWVQETKKRTETRITGYEEEVIDTVDVVVAQVDEVVGTEYLKGGYPAIKVLLGLGLGVKHYCSSQNPSPNWAASMQQGELLIERKLKPVQAKIEQLVNDPRGERPLIQLLEHALVS